MKRLLSLLLFAALALGGTVPSMAQIPGSNLSIDHTFIQGGTATDCLIVNTSGKLGQTPCPSGGGPFPTIVGSLVNNNIVLGAGADSVKDSGFQIVTSIAAGRVWGNPTSSAGAPIASDVINILAGTAGAPPYSSYADPTSGMYFSAAGNVDFSAGGLRALRITTPGSTNYVQITSNSTPSILSVGGNLPLQLFGSGSGGIDMLNSANGTQFLQRNIRVGTSVNYGYMVANTAADSGSALTYTATACSGGSCVTPPTSININFVPLAGTFQVSGSPVVTQANLGTGIYTALGINAGAAGAPVINGAAQQVAFASLGAAGTAGRLYRVSNVGTAGCWFEDNGTRWRPLNNRCLLYSMDSPSAGVNAVETVIAQYQMPAALWQINDVLRVCGTSTKSGTTNTGTFTIRVGTNGTTGDTGLLATGWMTAAAHQAAGCFDFRLIDATHTALVGGTSQAGYGASSTNGVPPTSTAITNVSNALWVDMSLTGGATDAVIGNTATVEYISSAQ